MEYNQVGLTKLLLQYYHVMWRSHNAEKIMHIKGRLLYQALILYKYVPFLIGTSLKGKNLFPEGANSLL